MEMVSVTLSIPKPIVDFLDSMQVDVEGYFVVSIVNIVEADLEEWLVNYHSTFSKCSLERVFSAYRKSLFPFSIKGCKEIKKKPGV
jgi:hypothetical protein